jgi:hypothetical protein
LEGIETKPQGDGDIPKSIAGCDFNSEKIFKTLHKKIEILKSEEYPEVPNDTHP